MPRFRRGKYPDLWTPTPARGLKVTRVMHKLQLLVKSDWADEETTEPDGASAVLVAAARRRRTSSSSTEPKPITRLGISFLPRRPEYDEIFG